ncbi:hypothetical protein [Euhalothece natronophila]|uniref:hypothetical protein n=1 Tax=Euhalothece natronophila TaxID=577489 RepID=UPI001C9A0F5E|nr:hypothetical protein [Euhalothece natronophila]
MILEPHYPQKVLSFDYRGFDIKITIDETDDEITYAAWIGYDYGWAMATPAAKSRSEAIQKAKQWTDTKLG